VLSRTRSTSPLDSKAQQSKPRLKRSLNTSGASLNPHFSNDPVNCRTSMFQMSLTFRTDSQDVFLSVFYKLLKNIYDFFRSFCLGYPVR